MFPIDIKLTPRRADVQTRCRLLLALSALVAVGILVWFAYSAHKSAVVEASYESWEDLKAIQAQFDAVFDGAPVGYQDVDTDGVAGGNVGGSAGAAERGEFAVGGA